MTDRARKPRLVLGLGNDLAGDDGIGLRVAGRLAGRPDLPDDVEVRASGCDLLRCQEAMRGRERVWLVDAVLGPEPPGTVLALDPDDPRLGETGGSAHQLSPTGALALLRSTDPAIRNVPVTLLGVVVEGARVEPSLSPALAGRLDAITGRVLARLRDANGAERAGADPTRERP